MDKRDALNWFNNLSAKERVDFITAAYQKMEYKIYNGGECIAKFVNEYDRDYCYNLLKDYNKEKVYTIEENKK